MASGSKPLKQSKDGMLEVLKLMAYKRGRMVAIQSKALTTRKTKNRPLAHQNKHKSFTKLGQKHARTRLKAQSMLRLKHGITRHVCKACMVCLNQVKTEVKHGKILPNTY